jgi:hypothetical protein
MTLLLIEIVVKRWNFSRAVSIMLHRKCSFTKVFGFLRWGWSAGCTFMPIDFSLLSSKKTQINGLSTAIDKRTSGYKRRVNALQSVPEQIPAMIQRALASGIDASYVLIDSWFTMPSLIKDIVNQGIDVIEWRLRCPDAWRLLRYGL